MIMKLIQKIKFKRFRRFFNGYRKLKNNNSLDMIAIIKDKLILEKFSKNRPMSSHIFGTAINRSELVLVQYLNHRFLNNTKLNKSILYSLGKPNSAIVFPMPREWFGVLEESGLKVGRFRSSCLWTGLMFLFYLYGLGIIGKNILQSISEIIRPVYAGLGRYVYFDGLAVNNVPNSENENKSRDIISWYRQWDGREKKLDSMCHNVQGLEPSMIGTVHVKPLSSTIPPINRISGLVRYIIWAFKAVFLSLADLLRGRWWHALLLNQAADAALVDCIAVNRLAREYLYHNSSWVYRPLLTYEVEAKGSLITFYFYSTNCEGFKRPTGYINPTNGWKKASWPRYLTWNEEQSDFIKRSVDVYPTIIVVGCIWFSDCDKDFHPALSKNIAMFDVTPARISWYIEFVIGFDFYTTEVCAKFNWDIQQASLERGYSVLFKQKRKLGSLSDSRYRDSCEKLVLEKNVQSVDADISAIRVIEKADIVISMPFTSTAIIAREMNKPSAFYDPLGLCQKDDRAAHGIPILQCKSELDAWIIAQE